MIEDKLSHDERLRLECIAQANVLAHGKSVSAEQVVDTAARFERYVKGYEK